MKNLKFIIFSENAGFLGYKVYISLPGQQLPYYRNFGTKGVSK